MAAADRRPDRCAADGARSRAGIERDQHEPGDMPPRSPVGRLALLGFAIPPSRSYHPRGFGASEPSFPRGRLGRQDNLDDRAAEPFPAMVINGGPQVFKLTP